MPSIVEVKVRCAYLRHARASLRGRRDATQVRIVDQHDTYFVAPHGLLKLRGDELIAYRRAGGRCDYTVVHVDDPGNCRACLASVLGIRGDVAKRREVWRFHRSTVHLDEVEHLGGFIEVETPSDEPDAHSLVLRVLGIQRAEALECSYLELLAHRRTDQLSARESSPPCATASPGLAHVFPRCRPTIAVSPPDIAKR